MSTTGTPTTPTTPTAPTPPQIWSAGDYAKVSDRMIPELGARLVALAGIRSGERVLDAAAGVGNAALPAAQRGARVTALDITPELLDEGARRARAAGLELEWVQGDAQAQPFEDATFDCVLSCVGVQFCADPHAAAAELRRLCRPGGRIALISWTPGSFIGAVLGAVSSAMGGGSRPAALGWGSPDTVSELLQARPDSSSFAVEQVTMPAASALDWVDFMATNYGPLVRARAALETRGEWERLHSELVRIADAHDSGAEAHNSETGDAFAGEAAYLAVVVRR